MAGKHLRAAEPSYRPYQHPRPAFQVHVRLILLGASPPQLSQGLALLSAVFQLQLAPFCVGGGRVCPVWFRQLPSAIQRRAWRSQPSGLLFFCLLVLGPATAEHRHPAPARRTEAVPERKGEQDVPYLGVCVADGGARATFPVCLLFRNGSDYVLGGRFRRRTAHGAVLLVCFLPVLYHLHLLWPVASGGVSVCAAGGPGQRHSLERLVPICWLYHPIPFHAGVVLLAELAIPHPLPAGSRQHSPVRLFRPFVSTSHVL
mmetsp:Transcript_32936/g.64621  ORF Transcript_32936/g.64621 Transcript_32936/m.64621 type:complete len:259 (-) Transcript_32936:450-1226(-)